MSMPADQIDRVEVMTNPSAAFRPDGSAGIINLITKKTQKPGTNGTLRLNVDTQGRHNGGVTITRRSGKLTLTGDASYRHDTQDARQLIQRETLDAASGKFLASTLFPGRTVGEMFTEGYDLVLAGKDTDFLVNGAKALAAARG